MARGNQRDASRAKALAKKEKLAKGKGKSGNPLTRNAA